MNITLLIKYLICKGERLVISDSPVRQVRVDNPVRLPKKSPISDYPTNRFRLRFLRAVRYFL